MKIIGWISREGELAEKSLLGKPCRDYVAAAMAACGTSVTARLDNCDKADVALVVRADAPGLLSETLRGLADAAARSSSRPSVLMAQDLKTPLAVAMDMSTLRSATEGESALPRVERLVENLNGKGVALRVWHDAHADTYYTVEDARGYAEAFRSLNAANVERHMQNGVIVLDPDRVMIEDGVKIGAGTMIYAGNLLGGSTVVGRDCVLYPDNRLQNATVGDGVSVESSVLENCFVGHNATVGPFACLRGDTRVGEGCRIGDFVVVQGSAIGDGTEVSHHAQVDSSELGKNVRVGCGSVFVRAGEAQSPRTRVDDDAVVGSNCNLVSPLHIGESAYVAAGSTVVADVPAGAMFVARPRGIFKEGWASRSRDGEK